MSRKWRAPTAGRSTESRTGTEALAGDRTMDETRTLVSAALSNQVDGYPWLQDLSDDWVAYENAGKTFKQSYSMDDDGNVTLADDAAEVEPRKVYTPVEPGNEAEPLTNTESEQRDRIDGRLLGAKGDDAAGGRVYDVQIIAFGDSKNRKRYPQSVMTEAVAKYDGAKAYDHHRTDEELSTSTINGLVGHYEAVHATAGGIQAELHLLPSATHTAEALDASLANQEKGKTPLVGISHDVMAKYKPIHVDGNRFMEATEIISVNSADVVADPAAGGQATRMVAGGTGDTDDPTGGEAMKLKELLKLLREADATKRAELLTEHKDLLVEYGLDDAAVTRILTDETETETETETGTETGTETETEEELVGASTESYRRDSGVGRMLIRDTASTVGLDERVIEAVSKRLPEKFTEAQLLTQLEGFKELRAEFEREALGVTGGRVPARPNGSTKEAIEKKSEKLFESLSTSATLGKRGERYHSFKEAFIDITGVTPQYGADTEDFNRVVMRESIGDGNYDSAAHRSLESAQASTWNLILGDSITRRMVADYEQPSLQSWRAVVSSIVPVQDFRTQRIERFGGYGTLPGVNEGAPYQGLTTPGNEEATYAITKRGGTEDLTIETIANDDLRLVARIPQKLGLAAAQTLFRFVWDMLNTNATYTPDSTTIFSSGHANTDTNALSRSAMDTGRRKLRAQAAYGDSTDILSIVPKTLVVNSTLENLAYEICTSAVAIPTAAPDGAAAGNVPNIHQGLSMVVVDYFSSTTNWFLLADTDLCPTVELGFYQGRQDPELFVQNDPTVGSVFTADKITYKIRHIYSGTPLDYRGMYRGNT